MKQIVFFFLFITLTLHSYSQANSASAAIITPVAYWDGTPAVPAFTTYNLLAGTGETFPVCAGSQSVYWLRFNIPTTIFTRSIKVTIQGASFSPVIDFYNSSLTHLECVSGTILRTNATTNPVIPGQDFYIRVSSTAPATGSSFQLGIEYYPTTEVRPLDTPYPTPTDTDGYTVCEEIRRNNLPQVPQQQRWTITPTTTPNNGSCVFTQTGSTSIAFINNFPCVCYGINYNIEIELQVDNHWCGKGPIRPIIMQSGATTVITTPNFQTLPFSGSVAANPTLACPGATYEWEFIGPNNSVFYFSTTLSFIPLSNISCLRWNRIYNCRVRINACNGTVGPWCGISGPNSLPLTFITPPMPTIAVPDGEAPTPTNDFCWASRPSNALVDVPFIPGVTQYIFQFTRVQPSAPYLPIASPKIVISSTSACFISQGNCGPGLTYRIGIKPGIGVVLPGQTPPATSCVPAQQSGDYSPWCYFSVSPAPAPVPGMALEPINEKVEEPNGGMVLERMERPGANGMTVQVLGREDQRFLSIDLNETEMAGTGIVQLFNLNGQEVFQRAFYYTDGASVIQLDMPQHLETGVYVVKVASDSNTNTGKIFISGR